MDLAILSLIIILFTTLLIGYYLATKYFYQGYENGISFPLLLFLTILVNSVGILSMLVTPKFTLF
jgi:hypothetical protein